MNSSLSVLITIYDKESPDHFEQCLESLLVQTMPAEEVVIVKDGPLRYELERVIEHYRSQLPIVLIQLQKNQGQGVAANIGMLYCSNDLVARIDSDDICIPERFARQRAFMSENPDIDVLGSSILEFKVTPKDGVNVRKLPSRHEEIAFYAKSRSPINNMSAMLRKSAVFKAGGYKPWRGFEDYYLWINMLMAGSKFSNFDEVHVYARCGNGMQSRRGGFKYAILEAKLFMQFRRLGFLTNCECIKSIALRCPFRLLPVSIRSFLYQHWLRDQM